MTAMTIEADQEVPQTTLGRDKVTAASSNLITAVAVIGVGRIMVRTEPRTTQMVVALRTKELVELVMLKEGVTTMDDKVVVDSLEEQQQAAVM